MRFVDILNRNDASDPWDVSHLEDQVAGGCQHDRDFMFLEAITLKRFNLAHRMKARYSGFHDFSSFLAVVRERYYRRLGTGWDGPGSPWEDRHEVVRFMTDVVDVCTRRNVWYFSGWLKILNELRRELRGETVNQQGDDDGEQS